MSDIWHDPETLDNGLPPSSPNHSAAYVVALLLLIVIGGGIALIAVGGGSKHHAASPSPSVSAVPVGPSPSSGSNNGPDTQVTPPLATPSPEGSAPAGPPTSSTAGLVAAYQQAMARARQQKSVHSVANEQTSSGLKLKFDDLDGATSGSQRITINGQVGQVRVVGHDSYFNGSASLMVGFFGTTTKSAVADHNRWVHLTPGVRGYNSVTADVTLDSTFDEIGLAGNLTKLAPQTKDGVRVYGIRGQLAKQDGSTGTGTLWVALSGSRLPVEFDLSSSGLASIQTFSGWGVHVNVSKPTGTVDGHGVFAKSSSSGGGGGTGPGVAV